MSLRRIAATLRETAGLEAKALGASHLAEAVARLEAMAGIDAGAYADLMAADVEARELLIGELLVHETSFFRYPASFHHLASLAVARAAARPGPVRVLSAACATGQEPYSAAIALLEAGVPPERVSIDAFDRSSSAIGRARAGRFDRSRIRGLAPERVSRWFESEGGTLSISPVIRALVRFETGNILDEECPFSHVSYDAVFCRNLLIYFTEAARHRALAAIRASLAPDGVLYLGHAEVPVARAAGFTLVSGSAAYACLARLPEVARPTAAAERTASGPPEPAAPSVPLEAPSRPAAAYATRTVAAPAIPAPRETDVLREARALADQGRILEACGLLDAAATRGRPGADHFLLLALLRRAAGRVREADEALGRALYLDPSHGAALLLAAVAAEGRGERNVAARLHARARAAAGEEGKR